MKNDDDEQAYPHNAGYQPESDTSKEAAESINIGCTRRTCLDELKKAEPRGLTAWEVEMEINRGRVEGHTRISPRFSELKRLGLIYETGEKRTNPVTNRSGAVCRLVNPLVPIEAQAPNGNLHFDE